MNESKIEQLQAELELALSLAAMTDAQKAHYTTLKGSEAETYLGKSAEGKDAEIAAVAKADAEKDPVVYTTVDGVEIKKSAGDAVVALVKAADEAQKENLALKKAQRVSELTKRAETELSGLPGTTEVHVALLEAVDGISDEGIRKSAMEVLKAHNEALSSSQVTLGHEGAKVEKASSSLEQLGQLAKAYSEQHKIGYAQAYTAVLNTAEGAKLYAQTV